MDVVGWASRVADNLECFPTLYFWFLFFFEQRENVELFLKGCENYGLKSQDLFQVNDLYEHKNLYMVKPNSNE